MIFDKRSLSFFLKCALTSSDANDQQQYHVCWIQSLCPWPYIYNCPTLLEGRSIFYHFIVNRLLGGCGSSYSFGLVTFLLLTIGSFILLIRLRFRAEKNFHPSLLAHVANLIAGLTLLYFSVSANFADFVVLLSTSFIELAISHLLLLFVAPWFFNFQRSLFSIFDTKTEPESLPFV